MLPPINSKSDIITSTNRHSSANVNFHIFFPISKSFDYDYSFRFDDSLNQSLYKVKQLESRLQMTEISNRALLEEVIRLQTELFNAVNFFDFIYYS